MGYFKLRRFTHLITKLACDSKLWQTSKVKTREAVPNRLDQLRKRQGTLNAYMCAQREDV